MLCRLAVLVLTVLFSATSAQAEIRKLMGIGDGKLTPRFELILTPPKGWVEEKEASKANGVQMLVPRGKDFHSAPALMYVKVSYRRDKEQTVEQPKIEDVSARIGQRLMQEAKNPLFSTVPESFSQKVLVSLPTTLGDQGVRFRAGWFT